MFHICTRKFWEWVISVIYAHSKKELAVMFAKTWRKENFQKLRMEFKHFWQLAETLQIK